MSTTTSWNDGDTDGAESTADREQAPGEGIRRIIRTTLSGVGTAIDALRRCPGEERSLSGVLGELRQVRGALTMLEFDAGARLVQASEQAVRALSEHRDGADETPRLVLRALQALRASLASGEGHRHPLPPLDDITEALLTRGGRQGHLLTPVDRDRPRASHEGGDGEVSYIGEWEPGGDEDAAVPGQEAQAGTYVAQIKENLKTVVQIMPQWWDKLRDPGYLETMNRAFAVIAERAGALNLTEIARLAALLERLVAKINDDMLPMTVQMMYGVIEQGVLKLGILFLQYCRPHDSPQDKGERAKLENTLLDLRLLTNEVDSVVSGGHLCADAPGVLHGDLEDGLRAVAPGASDPRETAAYDVGAFSPGRLEDLFIEANLLHSQLLPRVHMMRQQQRHIQTQLACMQDAGTAEDLAAAAGYGWAADDTQGLSDKVAAMTGASQLLARLIGECEECLQKYRRVTHELQEAILGDVTPLAVRRHLPVS